MFENIVRLLTILFEIIGDTVKKLVLMSITLILVVIAALLVATTVLVQLLG